LGFYTNCCFLPYGLLEHFEKTDCKEMDKEILAIKQAKEKGEKVKQPLLPNEDKPKQLLARCRNVIVKKASEWIPSQEQRARLMIENTQPLKKSSALELI
jgi:hypothetical protein